MKPGAWTCVFVFTLVAAKTSAQGAVEFSTPIVMAEPSSQPTTGVWCGNLFGSPNPESIFADGTSIVIVDRYAMGGSTSTSVALPGVPESVVVADIDQDGDHDIVVRTENSRFVAVLIQGSLGFARSDLAAAWRDPVHVADLDGNGSPDIVCGGERWMNQGGGVFGSPISFSLGSAMSIDVAPGDVDGDGDIDLISTFVGGTSAGSGYVVRVLRQDPGNVFTLRPGVLLFANAAYGTSKVADIDGDGRADIAFASWANSGMIRVGSAVGTAMAGMSPRPFTAFSGGAPTEISVGDLDLDGRIDVVVPTRHYLAITQVVNATVTIFSGTATGAVVPATGRGVPMAPSHHDSPEVLWPALVDDDLDGRLDLFCDTSDAEPTLARNLPATSIVPFVFQSIGPDIIYTNPLARQLRIDLRDSVGGQKICGRLITLTINLPSGMTWVDTAVHGDYALFLFSPGVLPNGPVPLTLTMAEGVILNATMKTLGAMTQPFGAGQTTMAFQPFANPIGGHITDSTGLPLAGVVVDSFPLLGGDGSVSPITPSAVAWSPAYTDSLGNWSMPIQALGILGNVLFVASCGSSLFGHYVLTVIGDSITITSGSPQMTCPSMPFPIPITGVLRDMNGQPIAGASIAFSPPPEIAINPISAITAADGSFSATAVSNGPLGTWTIPVTEVGPGISTSIVLTVNSTIVTTSAGNGQVVYGAQAFPVPLEVLVASCTGANVVGNVTFMPMTAGISLSSTSVPVDAAGHAAVVATVQAGFLGAKRVRASFGTIAVEFNLHARGLEVGENANFVMFYYAHERSNVPLMLAFDLATTPVTTTPWGSVFTSILTPSPTFAVLDGLGLFGPIEPEMVTTGVGNWERLFVKPPPLGLSCVAQMYGYDLNAQFPYEYIVSNPVTFSL